MPHIHDQPGQYDVTVSGYTFRDDGDEPRVLLHWHKILKCWMQFGGHVELHENPWQALAHELREESGYDLGQLRLLQPRLPRITSSPDKAIFHPYPVAVLSVPFPDIDHYHTDIAYALVTAEEPRHHIGQDESADIRLFTRSEIAALDDSSIIPNVRQIILYIFDECLPHWAQITADSWR